MNADKIGENTEPPFHPENHLSAGANCGVPLFSPAGFDFPPKRCYNKGMSVSFLLNLKQQPREFAAVPPVRSMAYLREHPTMPQLLSTCVQFCLRFSGSGNTAVIEIDGRRYEEEYPLLLIKRPGELIRVPQPEWNNCFFFTYCAEHFDRFRASGLDDDLVVCRQVLTPEISALFRRIQALAEHPGAFGATDRLDMLCFQMFQELMLARRRMQCPLPEEDEKLRRIISHLQRNFTDEIDLEELARNAGFSRRTFSRRWKQTGLPPPAQYLFNLRMEEAERLLAETALPIWKISLRLNYRNSAWFCAAFRRHTGETPLQFRRRHRGG